MAGSKDTGFDTYCQIVFPKFPNSVCLHEQCARVSVSPDTSHQWVWFLLGSLTLHAMGHLQYSEIHLQNSSPWEAYRYTKDSTPEMIDQKTIWLSAHLPNWRSLMSTMKSHTMESAWQLTEITKPEEGNCRPGGGRGPGSPAFPYRQHLRQCQGPRSSCGL